MIRILLLVIVLGVVYWLLAFLPIPEPFHTGVIVLMVLVVIWELLALAGYTRSALPPPN